MSEQGDKMIRLQRERKARRKKPAEVQCPFCHRWASRFGHAPNCLRCGELLDGQ